MKYGACNLPLGTAAIATGGRQRRIGLRRGARKLALRKSGVKGLIRGYRGVDRAARYARRQSGAADGAQQAALEGPHIGRIHSHQVGNIAGQKVAEQTKARTQHRVRRKLPSQRCSAVADGHGSGGKKVSQTR